MYPPKFIKRHTKCALNCFSNICKEKNERKIMCCAYRNYLKKILPNPFLGESKSSENEEQSKYKSNKDIVVLESHAKLQNALMYLT